jgi:hypothetical protein
MMDFLDLLLTPRVPLLTVLAAGASLFAIGVWWGERKLRAFMRFVLGGCLEEIGGTPAEPSAPPARSEECNYASARGLPPSDCAPHFTPDPGVVLHAGIGQDKTFFVYDERQGDPFA